MPRAARQKRNILVPILTLLLVLGMPGIVYFHSESWRVLHSICLRNYYLKEWNRTEPPRYSLECSVQLEQMVEDYDICAVVKVTKGLEDSLRLPGDEPKYIWDADRDCLEVEVEEYVYDRTGNCLDRLLISKLPQYSQSGYGDTAVYAYTGERLLLFCNVLANGYCGAGTVWGYILTEQDHLVPLNDYINQSMSGYGAKKANVLIKDIRDIYEAGEEGWQPDERKENTYQMFLENYEKLDFQGNNSGYPAEQTPEHSEIKAIREAVTSLSKKDRRTLRNQYLKNKYLWTLNDGYSWMPVEGRRSLAEAVADPEAYDACVLVEVTKGLEDSLEDPVSLKKEPWRIWEARYGRMELRVEEYLFDRTGEYQETLVLRESGMNESMGQQRWRIYGYTGERMVLFLKFPVAGNGLCDGNVIWGYIVTDDDYLVPMTDYYSEEMDSWGARKWEDYREEILHDHSL